MRASRIAVGIFIASFAAVGSSSPYITVYFQKLGLSLGAIGIFAGLAALCGLIAAPIWGHLADQVMGARAALVATAVLAALMAAIVGLTDVLAIAVLFAVIYQLAAAGVAPVLDAYTLDLVPDNRARFARFRVWGSASFVVTVALALFTRALPALPLLSAAFLLVNADLLRERWRAGPSQSE